MTRRSRTTDAFLGQHLALSLAAHLARSQLVREPLAGRGALSDQELLNVIGSALARTARLYVTEGNDAPPRELVPVELEGAHAQNGATILALKDGRLLAGVCIRRSDLQQAIAILRAVGIPEWGGSRADRENARTASAPASGKARELRRMLQEIEPLLEFPLQPEQVDRASTLAISLARGAPPGPISNLAMHLVSALHQARREENREIVRAVFARLVAALDALDPEPVEPPLKESG